MTKTLILAAAFGLAAAGAFAQAVPTVADPVAARVQAMKNNGFAAGLAGAMLKGEAPFDARVAQAAFRIMNSSATGFGHLFPAGSGGPNSPVKEAVWTDAKGFEAAVNKFLADTTAAVNAKVADMDAFKAEFGKVAANCNSCHEVYRAPFN